MTNSTQKERHLTLPCLKVEFDGSSGTRVVYKLLVEKSFHPRCRRCLPQKLCFILQTFLTDRSRVLFQSRTLLDHAFRTKISNQSTQ